MGKRISVHAHWESLLARYGYGVIGAGERMNRRLILDIGSSTAVMVERAVARTCFAASFLLRESLLRGFDAAENGLRDRIADARRDGQRHPPLARFGRISSRQKIPYGPRRLDPRLLLDETPWSLAPRPVRLQTMLTASLRAALTRTAVDLGIPRGIFVRHALACGWAVTCNEIVLVLAAGFRPAYLFPSLSESLPTRVPTSPWNGPNRQPLYGIAWMRYPGVDLTYMDPPLTEPDPADPLLDDL